MSPSFVLNVDQSKLQNAPAFDYSSFSGTGQSSFAQQVYSHFGLNWSNRNSDVGGAGSGISTGTGTGTDRSSGPDATRPGSSTSPSGTSGSRDQSSGGSSSGAGAGAGGTGAGGASSGGTR
jgi:hypothetical protein